MENQSQNQPVEVDQDPKTAEQVQAELNQKN